MADSPGTAGAGSGGDAPDWRAALISDLKQRAEEVKRQIADTSLDDSQRQRLNDQRRQYQKFIGALEVDLRRHPRMKRLSTTPGMWITVIAACLVGFAGIIVTSRLSSLLAGELGSTASWERWLLLFSII